MNCVVSCVTDSNYLDMTSLFVESYLDKASLMPVRIMIGSLGLESAEKARLSRISPVIEIVDVSESHSSSSVHDKAWLNNVFLKTAFLKEVFHDYSFDLLILADVDQIVVQDPVDLTNDHGDVCLVRRARPVARPEFRLDYIASNAVFRKNSRAALFLDTWIECLEHITSSNTEPPFETLALNLAAQHFSGSGVVFDLSEDTVSCANNYVQDRTQIIHMKSESRHDLSNVLKSRFHALSGNVQDLIAKEVPCVQRYL